MTYYGNQRVALRDLIERWMKAKKQLKNVGGNAAGVS